MSTKKLAVLLAVGAAVESPGQVAGPRVLGSLALLGLFALLPAIVRAARMHRGGNISR